jgi:shikimate kinase
MAFGAAILTAFCPGLGTAIGIGITFFASSVKLPNGKTFNETVKDTVKGAVNGIESFLGLKF